MFHKLFAFDSFYKFMYGRILKGWLNNIFLLAKSNGLILNTNQNYPFSEFSEQDIYPIMFECGKIMEGRIIFFQEKSLTQMSNCTYYSGLPWTLGQIGCLLHNSGSLINCWADTKQAKLGFLLQLLLFLIYLLQASASFALAVIPVFQFYLDSFLRFWLSVMGKAHYNVDNKFYSVLSTLNLRGYNIKVVIILSGFH